jgi:hypothetical protein
VTQPLLRFMRNDYIEDVTAQRIRQYEAKIGVTVKFPVPAEEIVEQVLNLSILWDEIKEEPGELILAGLQRQTRTIVMNEKHLELFEQKPGLRNSERCRGPVSFTPTAPFCCQEYGAVPDGRRVAGRERTRGGRSRGFGSFPESGKGGCPRGPETIYPKPKEQPEFGRDIRFRLRNLLSKR